MSLDKLHTVKNHSTLKTPGNGRALTKKEKFQKDLNTAKFLKYGKNAKTAKKFCDGEY